MGRSGLAMENNCIHHWIIEIPNGPKSNGICKKCGETRVYINTFSEGVWTEKRSPTTRTIRPDEIDLELVG